ncbi:MAG: bifunctional 4-hydroxy-2-oxoglutarate aldolase/2-dehydro-3-deoxy-phosphogluconate aldolase [Clostridiales bacterium]|jgi:2-dehydro-3-deoxyphosphogluconate aldolase/(4S)-4-hydroxy-2-oxoglutarate aldolase|nr:bifunctional 4-hydroxy-2-oxoglutarate aldolase/2-dehydro-3-deoxy-phosphogluconate aldolase [Clostridiales bacterium]
MEAVLKAIERAKLVPVVVIEELGRTEVVMGALCEGGLPIAEITFRTAYAAEAIELAVKKFPDMIIGAGTVISSAQCERAVTSGAKFIVSPGLSEGVAKVCKERGIPYFPGCATPTEIIRALELGIDVVKFFPAQVYGGLKAINALGAAFPQVRFIPTGGVDNSNLAEFLKSKRIFACGGSWLLKDDIVSVVREAVKIVNDLIGGN